MAIDSSEIRLEINNLEETEIWIDNALLKITEDDTKLKNKIEDLRKQAKGKYNEELETKEKLYNITHKNLKKYTESKPQPYFGRIDFREYKRNVETFYIGKFGLGDITTGEEKVIDWRSPIADLYYSGAIGESYYKAPVGVINGELNLKRKFLIQNGRLKNAFDDTVNEVILKSSDDKENILTDKFLQINLEKNVSSKLKDVVATIQREQNDIIRSEKNIALIVQGSAGSGKTTVALHRLAYLLYKYKDKLSSKEILVVGPNKLFLDYISEVLPDLGINNIKQTTFDDISHKMLELKGKIITKDKKLSHILEDAPDKDLKFILDSSKLKGSIFYKDIIDEYVKFIEIKDSEIEDIKVEEYVLFDKDEIKRLYNRDLSNLSINNRKDEIKRYLRLKINNKIKSILDKIDFYYEYMIARVKKSMNDSIERREKLIKLYDERDTKKSQINNDSKLNFENYFNEWKQIKTDKMYLDLFNENNTFNNIITKHIDYNLACYIKKILNYNYENGLIDSDDLAAMLYLKFKIEGIPKNYKYKHIVIDEAQDYSLFQIYVLNYMVSNSSITMVGDIGQGIYYYKGINNWRNLIEQVFKIRSSYIELTQSYRSTVEIMKFSNKVLKKQDVNLTPAKSVLRHGDNVTIKSYKTNREFCENVNLILEKVHKINRRSVAIIGKTYSECRKIREYLKKYTSTEWKLIKETDKNFKFDRVIIPSYMTKGLEFDCTIIYNCNEKNYDNSELDKKILYVVLTRALHLEYIFFQGNMSKILMD
ncbi:AAA family ATPase [Clostridium fermenticellae]|uniref:AAA family ATPase n=1 Tax=Clostridium fermenticellae TaxID=2068654 RepID=A0A386H3P6_9CLOT|nr:RNA polymerase recycling motor HelD [Clostridium fermenticellae]AYD40274.1 AAA family ATPase [Clostridium fermenticellae]